MANLCDGEGRFNCYCAGDHCACGMEMQPMCTGCEECAPADPDLESLAAMEPSIERRPMARSRMVLQGPTIGEMEERRGRYGD